MRLLVASLLFAATVARADELCIAGRCRTVTGTRFTIPAEHVGRTFVWREQGGRAVAVGVAEGERVDLASLRTMRVALRGAVGEEVAIAAGAASATLDPRTAAALRTLAVPREAKEVAFVAAHHKPITRATGEDMSTLTFIAYPSISGIVTPPGAVVLWPDDTVAAQTEPDGRFRIDVTDTWPAFVRIAAPGKATKQLALPAATASFDAGRIVLSNGGALRVTLPREAAIDVLRGDTRIATRSTSTGTVDIDALEPGAYVVLLRGAQPLQRLAIDAEVREGETTALEPQLKPVTLVTATRWGKSPLPRAKLTIGPPTNAWRSEITTDDEGRHETELWQQGELFAFIDAGALHTTDHADVRGTDTVTWSIDIPRRRVDGTVVDERGRPVANAAVMLETERPDEGSQTASDTDANGRFSFPAVLHGQQTLTVTAAGHLPATRTFTLGESDESYAATIRLERARALRLVISEADGRPAANAIVVDGSASHEADANGAITIAMRAGEKKTLYVVPRSGSFAAVDVSAPDDDAPPLPVIVPEAASTIVVRSNAGRVFLAMRYNGRLVPQQARRILGTPLHTDTDGSATFHRMPAGLYELWPYFNAAELRAITSGSVAPPVRLAAQPGENRVDMTFERD